MRLKDKVAIITGASKGIGAATAKMFAAEGAKVMLAARSTKEMDALAEEIRAAGGECMCMRTDVTSREDMMELARKTYETYGKIDILMNNAGYPLFKYAIDDMDPGAEERYQAIMDTNVRGYWYGARFVVPYMKKNGAGSIINIASVRGHGGVPEDSAYCAAKGAVIGMTKSLAVELAPYNIRVNSISPGAIQVQLGHWVLSRYGEEVHKEYVEKFRDIHLMGMKYDQPLHTIGEPDDIAYMAVYLASEESKFVTGSDMVVDGGLITVLPEPGCLDMDMLTDLHEKQKPMNEWFAKMEEENSK